MNGALTKTIIANGKAHIVALPMRKSRPLVPCRGRLVINCTNGIGCKGHRIKWLLLDKIAGGLDGERARMRK